MERKNQTARAYGFHIPEQVKPQTAQGLGSGLGSQIPEQVNQTAQGFGILRIPDSQLVNQTLYSGFPIPMIPHSQQNSSAVGQSQGFGFTTFVPHTTYTNLFSTIPPPVFPHPPSFSAYPPTYPYSSPFEVFDNFNDDEPLPAPPASTTLPNAGLKNVAIETSTEFPALAASDFNSSFAVLLGIHAPPLPMEVASENQRVPIDLVAVLDVSGSMRGEKMSLLKSATKFVVDHMLPSDRLSIISFSSHATRILPLRRMTESGRKVAEFAVDRLQVEGATNIVDGLNMGARVLEQRRQCNPVSSIIFLSDGQDTENSRGGYRHSFSQKGPPGYLRLLSSSISSCNSEINDENQRQRFPVYTFGVGMDHDAVAMNSIADGSSGGTFSFVESPEMIPRSFARCIGGLFSVVAQEVRIKVLSASAGVDIKSIPSGRHANEISCQLKQGIIHVGDLFAEEKKEFLIYLSVPIHSADHMVTEDEVISKTPLLDIVCYYRNAFTDEIVQIDGPSIEILRPITPSPADKAVNLKVDGQRNRVAVAESIAKAKEMADRGNLKGAKDVLTSSRETLMASASAQSGAEMVSWLEAELKEITARMETMDLYDRQGRAFMLAGMSAHDAQRATSRNYTFLQAAASGAGASFGAAAFASAGAACGAAYDTPMMAQMQSMLPPTQPQPQPQSIFQMPPPPTQPRKDNGSIFQMSLPKNDNGWRK